MDDDDFWERLPLVEIGGYDPGVAMRGGGLPRLASEVCLLQSRDASDASVFNCAVHVHLRLQQPLHLRVVARAGGAHELCAVARHGAEERVAAGGDLAERAELAGCSRR